MAQPDEPAIDLTPAQRKPPLIRITQAGRPVACAAQSVCLALSGTDGVLQAFNVEPVTFGPLPAGTAVDGFDFLDPETGAVLQSGRTKEPIVGDYCVFCAGGLTVTCVPPLSAN